MVKRHVPQRAKAAGINGLARGLKRDLGDIVVCEGILERITDASAWAGCGRQPEMR